MSAGYTDPITGIRLYGEDDVSGKASDMLNLGMESVRAALAGTGWVDLSTYLPTAYRGQLLGQRRAGTTMLRFQLLASASIPNTTPTDVGTALPAEWRPSAGPNARGVTYMSGGYTGGAYLSSAGVLGVVQDTGAARTGCSGSITYMAG
ncbi:MULTISPECIES: hypothetical protein [unclassified Leucobacter]|uniref:hypothetical protein n=1 Tax=unclassified Leucobacter TaxID=2621730 RepID=UPI00062179F9|nr:hypothetical protein [Leucobacter sp. Ag1]KKI19671.1 hypothetical protein XM48_09405 [Leucobacter sp. Ag1]